MKKTPLLRQLIQGGLAVAALALISAAPVQAAGPKAYRFTASGGNISGSSMTIDHPAFNGKRTVKPVITQFWDAVYNPHPVGLRYNEANGHWAIENEDGAAMPNGAKFNVLLAPGTKQHLCTPANSFFNRSFTLVQKNNPNGMLLASHVINPVKGMPGVTLTKNFGTFFETITGAPFSARWSIYDEAGVSTQPPGPVAFNIADVTKLKIGGSPSAFFFVATAGTLSGHITTITNPLTDGNPNAMVFVTHVYRPGSLVYLDHEVGVYYTGGKWNIFNQDFAAMPTDAAFVVAVIPAATP